MILTRSRVRRADIPVRLGFDGGQAGGKECPRSRIGGFTLVEILIAIGILALVLTAIYSSWTAILRAAKVGQEAAASAQRARIAMRTIEDSLLGVQSFTANLGYYGFFYESGSEGTLSFVSRLPKSFPRSGKFGDLDVRRVTFTLESGAVAGKQLVLRQKPLLTEEYDIDEKEHPLVLARYVNEFQIEFWDDKKKDWVDDWIENQTNQIPKLVKLSMRLADKPHARREQETEVVRIVGIPSVSVLPPWQAPAQPGGPGAPGVPPGGVPPGGVPPGGVPPGGVPPGGFQPGGLQPGGVPRPGGFGGRPR